MESGSMLVPSKTTGLINLISIDIDGTTEDARDGAREFVGTTCYGLFSRHTTISHWGIPWLVSRVVIFSDLIPVELVI